MLPSRWFVPIPPRTIKRQRVVVLDEELPSRVEAERAASLRCEQPAGALRDEIHSLVPARLVQFAVSPHERTQKPVLGIVGLPAVEALRAETPVIDTIDVAPTNPNDSSVTNTDVEPAAVRAEHAGGLHPTIDGAIHVLIHTDRPIAPSGIRRSDSPRVPDPIDHSGSRYPRTAKDKRVEPGWRGLGGRQEAAVGQGLGGQSCGQLTFVNTVGSISTRHTSSSANALASASSSA